MGQNQIVGHTGGEVAKVDENNRLHVQATVDDAQHTATETERAYNINTGWITLTDATDTGVLYFENLEIENFHIEGVAVGFDTATNGTATELARLRIIKSITGGDIVTDAVACPVISNSFVGSGKTLAASVYIGDTADGAHTGGTVHAHLGQADFTRGFYSLDMTIPKGENILITVAPPSSSNSFPVYVALIGHITDPASE